MVVKLGALKNHQLKLLRVTVKEKELKDRKDTREKDRHRVIVKKKKEKKKERKKRSGRGGALGCEFEKLRLRDYLYNLR